MSADNIAKVSNVEFAVKRGCVPKAMMLPIKWTAPEAMVLNVRIYIGVSVFKIVFNVLASGVFIIVQIVNYHNRPHAPPAHDHEFL